MGRKKVKVKLKNKIVELKIKESCEQNLLEVLQENNIMVTNLCLGNGTCGKCKVKVLSGELPITEADKKKLTGQELTQGIRLACKVSVKQIRETEELYLEIVGENEEEIVVEGVNGKETTSAHSKKKKSGNIDVDKIAGEDDRYFIAIDIGTTTIAMALVNEKTKEICDTYVSLNHQRKFGADVISRIVAANDGKGEELKRLIEKDLWNGIEQLIENRLVSRIVMAGNTTMIHLLMGYSCQSLGKHPFISKHLEQIECRLEDCISVDRANFLKKTPVTILPGISAFVGGDIVAGLLKCPEFENHKPCLLLDLGTNGEMVLGTKERMVVASTAAGPAFEGGNITCGTAGIPGSICQVKIENLRAVVKTIKSQMPPIGICGTGLISAIARLLENHLIDENGNLKYPFREQGFPLWIQSREEKIALYQTDIRQFQMAKSAIRAGIDVLMKEYGCTAEDINCVYLAGGMGVHLLEEDAICTGILPKEFKGKIIYIGNGSLQGAIELGMGRKTLVEDIRKNVTHISLAEKEMFQGKYLEYMNF